MWFVYWCLWVGAVCGNILLELTPTSLTTDYYFTTTFSTQNIQLGGNPGRPTVFTLGWGTSLSSQATLLDFFSLVNSTSSYSSFYTPYVANYTSLNTTAKDIIYIPWNMSECTYYVTPTANDNGMPFLWLYQRTDSLSFNFVEGSITGNTFTTRNFQDGQNTRLYDNSRDLCDLEESKSPFTCPFTMAWETDTVAVYIEPGLAHVMVPQALVPNLDRSLHTCYALDLLHGGGTITLCSDDLVVVEGLPRYVLLILEDIQQPIINNTIILGTNLPGDPLALYMYHALGPRIIIGKAYVQPLRYDLTRLVCIYLIILWTGLYFQWTAGYLQLHLVELIRHGTTNWHVLLGLCFMCLGWATHVFILYYYHFTGEFQLRYYRSAYSSDVNKVNQWYWVLWAAFHTGLLFSVITVLNPHTKVYWYPLAHNLYLLGVLTAWAALVLDTNEISQEQITLGSLVLYYGWNTVTTTLTYSGRLHDRYDILYGLGWVGITCGGLPSVIGVFLNVLLSYYPGSILYEDWLLAIGMLTCGTLAFLSWVFHPSY